MSFEHTDRNIETQGQEIIPEFHSIIEKVKKNAVNIATQV